MPIYYLSAVVAFLVCAGSLPAVKRLASHLNLYDPPGPLKIHSGSIPRIGGIAMIAGVLAATLAFAPPTSRSNALLLLVFLTIWVVGLIDDITGLPSYLRLAVHIAAGAAFWFGGWHLNLFRSAALDLAATCVFVALVVNAMNLLDGMDGLAAGTATIAGLGFLLVSASDTNVLEIVTAATLVGICLGVLTVNAPPATMFMGDSGSTLMGIVLAFLSLNWIQMRPTEHNIIVPLILLAAPLADVAFAVIRRARSQAGLFDGDRRHFYDLLLRRGWNVTRVLQTSLITAFILMLTGWMCARSPLATPFAVMAILCGLALAAYFLGSFQPESGPIQHRHPEALRSATD